MSTSNYFVSNSNTQQSQNIWYYITIKQQLDDNYKLFNITRQSNDNHKLLNINSNEKVGKYQIPIR